ncbi:MAG: tetratricopeptide repeat protein [Kiritimatiellales bacterium]
MEHDPQQQERHKELEQHEVKEALKFLKRYGTLIGAGITAAAVIVLITHSCSMRSVARQLQAEQMLQAAQTPEQMAEVAEKYKSLPIGETALLDLAKTLYNNGDYAGARARYNKFLNRYKKSEQHAVAELGLVYCTEADGDFAAAAEEFNAFAVKYANHNLYPVAVLSIARNYEQAGNIDEARIVLEDFLTDNPRSVWIRSAEDALTILNKK